MSLERVLGILVNLGLTKTEAKVYVYLAKTGSQKVNDIGSSLRMTKQQLYPILKSLKRKEIVNCKLKKTPLFSAITIEKLLDLQVKKDVRQVQIIEENKDELLESWQTMSIDG